MNDKELKIEEILNLADGTPVVYECEKVTEIRYIKTNVLYGESAECNLGYYMPISDETQKRHKYRIYAYKEVD